MKSLSLSVPRVLILVGTPGAGKTYFAEKFSEMFSAPIINQEVIRATLTENQQYTATEDRQVAAISQLMLDQFLRTNKTFLYEGGLEARSARTNLIKHIRTAGYEPMIIWVQTEQNTAKQRAVKGVRGHTNQLISENRYEQLVQKFTPPNESEKPVVISGKHTYASQAKIVLKRLADSRQKEQGTASIQVPERATRKPGNITVKHS